ncbi:hypothetical protein CCACVL1_18398 [Corchorus capsularis]|uniref:DUF4283 domain-containing protein n=1 Tax=Corchorus capsularis TaxID=210143 RepID=A0A1R3HLP4_COCAP|nr:hypothetical protein CCACVL1_18398 [Corchorus capsularis]
MAEQFMESDSDKATEDVVDISDDDTVAPDEEMIADRLNNDKKEQPSFSEKVRGKPRAKLFDQGDLFGALDDTKLLGRNIGYKTLLAKVIGLWNPKGDFELIEIGEGFFIAKFYLDEDLRYVLEEGPWMIFGHYLTMRRWRPDFWPSETVIDTTAAWIRFLELAVEYYNEIVLLALGNLVGRALKVDNKRISLQEENLLVRQRGPIRKFLPPLALGKCNASNRNTGSRIAALENEVVDVPDRGQSSHTNSAHDGSNEEDDMGDQEMSDRHICSSTSSNHRTRDPPNSQVSKRSCPGDPAETTLEKESPLIFFV